MSDHKVDLQHALADAHIVSMFHFQPDGEFTVMLQGRHHSSDIEAALNRIPRTIMLLVAELAWRHRERYMQRHIEYDNLIRLAEYSRDPEDWHRCVSRLPEWRAAFKEQYGLEAPIDLDGISWQPTPNKETNHD